MHRCLSAVVTSLFVWSFAAASLSAADPVTVTPDKLGLFRIPVKTDAPAIELATPTPKIVAVSVEDAKGRRVPVHPLLVFNADATEARVEFPPRKQAADGAEKLVVATADASGQQADGRIVFSATDAIIDGATAKLESHPGSDRIGFWTRLGDAVQWDYKATRPGTYSVELTYSLAGDGATSETSIQLGEAELTAEIAGTGSWYHYRTVTLGTLQIPQSGPTVLRVRGLQKTGAAVMNLKAVVLQPAPEGQPIVQADNGEILCHARDVTAHGVKVQYEPRPEKNTVGYWVEPSDWVHWDFTVQRPGKFAVEVLQGCGKGHGGSEVDVFVNDRKLSFIVEDTGHFQNFKPRVIGEVEIPAAGLSTLKIVPRKKASVAVMDVRQVRLIPVKP